MADGMIKHPVAVGIAGGGNAADPGAVRCPGRGADRARVARQSSRLESHNFGIISLARISICSASSKTGFNSR
jgi:hypothetical protein